MSFLTNVHNLTDDNVDEYDKISYSEMESLLRCKRKWQYQYLDGFEQASTPGYFAKGTYLHRLMALLVGEELGDYDAHAQVLESLEEEGVELSIDENEIHTLRRQAREVTENILKNSREILGVEQEFYVDMGYVNGKGKPVLIHGFVDGYTLNEDGNLWLLEYKTAGRAWSADQFNFHMQDDIYALSMQTLLQREVKGATYVFFIRDRLEYKNVLYNRGMLETAYRQVGEAIEMRDSLATYPMEPLWGCGGCPFQAVCRAEIGGQDPQYMLSTQFVQNQDRIDRANRHRKDN